MRALLLMALVFAVACGKEKTIYQTTPVTRGDLIQMVTATGQLNPVTNVQVGSQISGTIAKLFADFNSSVSAGQVVAQIDPATYQAAVHQTEADLANSKAALELAQVNARRAEQLFQNKLIPQSDYDQAQASLHQAEANVQLKAAALERARVDLARCTIYSPVDGTVISRSVDVGQTVAASLSAPVLFQIANDLTKMQINASVAEADIGNVEEGQDVEFTVDAFPNRAFHGKVVQVRNSPVTVQNVVTYDTIVGVENPELKLKPGMTANVSIIIARRDDALKIPNSALRYRPPDTAGASTNAAPARGNWKRKRDPTGSARTVYVLAGNKPQPVSIKTGISDGIFTEVLDGLKEGDLVITSATSKTGAAQSQSPFSPGMPRRF
jgi:HlyD family secretion protein